MPLGEEGRGGKVHQGLWGSERVFMQYSRLLKFKFARIKSEKLKCEIEV